MKIAAKKLCIESRQLAGFLQNLFELIKQFNRIEHISYDKNNTQNHIKGKWYWIEPDLNIYCTYLAWVVDI